MFVSSFEENAVKVLEVGRELRELILKTQNISTRDESWKSIKFRTLKRSSSWDLALYNSTMLLLRRDWQASRMIEARGLIPTPPARRRSGVSEETELESKKKSPPIRIVTSSPTAH